MTYNDLRKRYNEVSAALKERVDAFGKLPNDNETNGLQYEANKLKATMFRLVGVIDLTQTTLPESTKYLFQSPLHSVLEYIEGHKAVDEAQQIINKGL